MATYNKLVRDGIPAIIAKTGKQYKTSTVAGEILKKELQRKLLEEAEEFLQSQDDPAELADVLEVIDALLPQLGLDWDGLRKIQTEKRNRRGGFEQGILLEWVED